MGDGNDTSYSHPLQNNCREDWPLWTCIAGNISGLCSTTMWFLVLLPQVWKNFRRKSCRGLSVLWATANFTASLINLFFVFIYASIPLYIKINAVYCPVLEFTLLIQFWVYGQYRMLHKVPYLCACVVVWGTIIAVELLISVGNTLEYAAITLWCTETFPQVILNMKLQSTNGQSLWSVTIAMIGKTTDFVTNNFLALPRQYVILVYFSSSVAYINGLQVAWYYGNELPPQSVDDMENTEEKYKSQAMADMGNNESTCKPQPMEKVESTETKHKLQPIKKMKNKETEDEPQPMENVNYTETTFISQPETSLVANKSTKTFVSRLGFKSRGRKSDGIRIAVLCLLSTLLVTFVVGFVWNIKSLFGLFGPAAIVSILLCARVYIWKCR